MGWDNLFFHRSNLGFGLFIALIFHPTWRNSVSGLAMVVLNGLEWSWLSINPVSIVFIGAVYGFCHVISLVVHKLALVLSFVPIDPLLFLALLSTRQRCNGYWSVLRVLRSWLIVSTYSSNRNFHEFSMFQALKFHIFRGVWTRLEDLGSRFRHDSLMGGNPMVVIGPSIKMFIPNVMVVFYYLCISYGTYDIISPYHAMIYTLFAEFALLGHWIGLDSSRQKVWSLANARRDVNLMIVFLGIRSIFHESHAFLQCLFQSVNQRNTYHWTIMNYQDWLFYLPLIIVSKN